MFRGAVQLTTAMLFAVGFLMLFLIGGITGVFFAAVPVDFALHDTYFVVSHLHYVLATGSAFGVFAAVYYWYPKMFGRMMNEGLGKVHFALTFLGANMLFWPQLMLGLDGMPRRINDYAANGGWELMNMISSIGAFVVAVAVLPFLFNLIYSAINGPRAPDDRGRPTRWSGPPRHRRRRTISIPCRRSAPSGRCSINAGAFTRPRRTATGRSRRPRRRGTGREGGMTTQARAARQPHFLRRIFVGEEPMTVGLWGMVFFIFSEVMFFSGLIAAYLALRNDALVWAPINGGETLEVGFRPILFTIFLLASSIPMQWRRWRSARAIGGPCAGGCSSRWCWERRSSSTPGWNGQRWTSESATGPTGPRSTCSPASTART